MPRGIVRYDTAQDIRAAYAAGECTQASIARAYGISRSQACRIVRGKTWKPDSRAALKARLETLEHACRKLNGYIVNRRLGDGGYNVSIHMENFADLKELMDLKPWRADERGNACAS